MKLIEILFNQSNKVIWFCMYARTNYLPNYELTIVPQLCSFTILLHCIIDYVKRTLEEHE